VVAVPSRGRADLQAHAPEADAVRALYEQYGRQIYTFCFSRLRSREEAEDAVQSTFLNAFRALQRDVAPSHESAWLYKIAEKVCLTRARSSVRRRRVETPGDLDAISEVVPAHEPETEELANLPQALESMPDQQRRALLLREWQGLSYREIAEEMELSQSAVETLLFRARRTLAAGLASDTTETRGKLARLRAGGDAGAIVTLLKTLLFSGGAKVVIAGAVAATGVVGISPGARHTIDDLFVPHVKSAAPAVHHVVAAKPKPVHTVLKRVVPVAPTPAVVAPRVVHKAKKKQKAHPHVAVAVARRAAVRHVGRHGSLDQPLRPPAAPVPASTPAPAAGPEPAQPPAPAHAQQPASPAAARDDGHATGKRDGNGHGKGKSEAPPSSQPAPAPPAPVVPPVAPAPEPPQPAADGTGNGDGHDHGNGNGGDNGHGHDGHGDGHGTR
jgi:RNA polymerase sigma factor (sigma-70 family)